MKATKAIAVLNAAILLAGTFAQAGYPYDPRRGSPAEYDPGPQKGSKWVELFGSTPNYRSIGQFVLGGGDEKFRWQFGPMWYRGRLGENEVKVFVVGQEGAQDENVTNRAFTGSTGTKTQKLLNAMGIYKSYLFLNTFVYTINGQLDDDPRFKWLEQGQNSPIVEYRHSLFTNMATTNKQSLSVLLGVGSGGKASVATWVNTISGSKKCFVANNLAKCDTSEFEKKLGLKNKLLVIGVPHPGGASPANGGLEALKNIVRGFTTASQRVAARMADDKFLDPDVLPSTGKQESRAAIISRLKEEYKYGDAPVPFHDFAFGTNWRMGASGTTSNRWGADSIQVFSKEGIYGDKSSSYSRPQEDMSGKAALDKLMGGDLAYESPRFDAKNPSHADEFDYGPCGWTTQSCEISKKLQAWPDFSKLSTPVKPVSDGTFGNGAPYRGRLDKAKLLVLADQTGHDDFFSARALTDQQGQKLQTLLNATGIGSDYAILRVLPVDTQGLKADQVVALATDKAVTQAREAILESVVKTSGTKVVIALGPVSQTVAKESGALSGKTVVSLDLDSKSWSPQVPKIASALGTTARGGFDGSASPIPREDLPNHTRWWMGTSGSRASRGESSKAQGDYYRVYAPSWVPRLKAKELSADEKTTIRRALDQGVDEFKAPAGAEESDEKDDSNG